MEKPTPRRLQRKPRAGRFVDPVNRVDPIWCSPFRDDPRLEAINPKGRDGKGVYHFNRTSDNTLQFTLVRDACKLRKKNVLQVWHKK